MEQLGNWRTFFITSFTCLLYTNTPTHTLTHANTHTHTHNRNDTKMLACTLTYTCLCLYLCHSHFLICYTLSLPFSFSLFIFLSCICEMSILKSTQKLRKTHLHDLQVLSFKPRPRPGSSHAHLVPKSRSEKKIMIEDLLHRIRLVAIFFSERLTFQKNASTAAF